MTAEPTSSLRTEIAVGAVIIDQGELLLVKRGRNPGKGFWSLPGGRVEVGETLAAAVEREVDEETSLDVACGPFIGWVERIGADHHFVIMDFRADLVGSRTATAGDDADAVAWIPLADVTSVDLVDGLLAFLTEHHILA